MDEQHDDWRSDALAWAGRKVLIVDGPSAKNGRVETGTVICVDATDYRPSAWVKIGRHRSDEREPSYASYRSCDLCWLEDAETAEGGPVWCSNPNTEDHAALDAAVVADRIRAVASGALLCDSDTRPKAGDAKLGSTRE